MSLYKLYCRAFQTCMKIGAAFLPWGDPVLLTSTGTLSQHIKAKKISRVLIVTDQGIVHLGLLETLLKTLKEQHIAAAMYDQTQPNPTVENIGQARKLYLEQNCQAIIGFGGGSPMDCAKLVGARIARPRKPLLKMRGLFKVLKKLPPVFCVPTTAGTGAETTIAAVFMDPAKQVKLPVMDPFCLRPAIMVLDPKLTVSLPPHLTATTGMDALTHAVEAYIGRSNTKKTKAKALEAAKLIFSNIELAYADGKNLIARENMMMAARAAGTAFTRAYVGNVHAIAHALGAFYNVPHGFANAVIMPYVLDFYGEKTSDKLAELSSAAGISGDFVAAIRAMNERMGIPATFGCIKEEDIPALVAHALKEANPLYPVPVIMNKTQCAALIKQMMD